MDSSINLKLLLKTCLFKDAELFTTEKGLDNPISSINIMDLLEIEQWLTGNELLIIGNFMKKYFTREFIDKLRAQKISAILSKKKFRHYISEDTIDLLRYYNIPLILIDDHYAWRDVIIAFQEAEISQKTLSLIEAENFLKQIIQYFSHNHSLNRLCQIVYETTNLSIALTNNKLELLDHSEDWSWKEYLDRFSLQNIGRFSPIGCDLNQTSIYGFCYRSIFLNKLDIHLFFIPIYQNQSLSHYIILKTNSTVEEIEATILSKIENIKSIFLLKQVLEQEFKKNNNYFRNIIFDDLLKITEPNEDLLRKYSLSLGQEIHSDLQVLLISDILQSKDILAFENVFLQLTNHLLASQINLQHVHFFSRNQEILLVLGKDSTLLKQLDLVKDIVIDFTGHKHFYIGISSIKPYWKLSIALDEARQAIGFAKSNLKSQQIQYYQDIGILKLLTNDQGAINQLFVNELFDQFLSPLLKYDDKNHTQLYPTLVTFFDNHFSYTESSQILFIHVNTLRARLSKIESLLSISLKNTDQVMSVHLAIRLYQSQLQA